MDDLRTGYLARLALIQISNNQAVVIEANARSQSWNLRPIQELRTSGLHESLHAWCRHQTEDQDACGAKTIVWSNLEFISSSDCTCRTDRQHFTIKHFADAKPIETLMLADLIRTLYQGLNNARDRQPEFAKTKMSALIPAQVPASEHPVLLAAFSSHLNHCIPI